MNKIRELVDTQLHQIYVNIGIDTPINHEDIIHFVSEDIEASTTTEEASDMDVAIAFRRLIERYTY